MAFFKVLYQSKKSGSRARLGEIKTVHGAINTPAFVPVATKGTIKAIIPNLIKDLRVQVAFVNTYHLVDYPGVKIIKKAGGIHCYSQLNIPLMSDSGGFQVFSLASKKEKIKRAKTNKEKEPLIVKITDEGVKFRSTFDGKLFDFTPEVSMKYQIEIGADINMAFDECIAHGVSYQYAKKATERTHQWLERSIKEYKKLNNKDQKLYGVIQGGVFEDLRKQSAAFVASQNTDGVAIGGVSVGETKKEMRDQVKWVSGYLPSNRPVHLLGIGQFDDILDLVPYGIDTFDCVEPTRLARMGTIFTNLKLSSKLLIDKIDLYKSVYKNHLEPVDANCDCYVCQNFTKSYLHHLFKQRELLGYTLATFHNLYLMEKFFEMIREMILTDRI